MNRLDSPDELRLGVPEIDAQHARQVDLVRAFRDAVEQQHDAALAARILDQLRNYTAGHFGAEQALMRQHAYPAYEAHVHEHERLLEHLDRLQAGLSADTPRSALLLAEALTLWLTIHVQTMDRAFASHLRQVRPGATA